MGTDEGLKQLAKAIEETAAMIERGEVGPDAMPRLFYCGHKLVHSWAGLEHFKCPCGQKWDLGGSNEDRKAAIENPVCPACGKADPSLFWYRGEDHSGHWKCYDCKHEWDGEDGTKCPSCGSVKES